MYPLGGGVRGDPANSVLARIGGGELAVSVRTPFFFFAGQLQNRNKVTELFRPLKLSIPISPV